MFETFDFSILDSADFKEDAVREEIIAPILKRLGYQPSGQARVQRSKTLVHPFVRIGTRKHTVSIIPDYTLWYEDTALLILDAKSPAEQILKSHHVEQAYSYAIHPEIRCRHFALCNGRQLVVFDVEALEPILVMALQDVDAMWLTLEKFLAPNFLRRPHLRTYQPDLGLALLRMGMSAEVETTFLLMPLQLVARVSDDLYTATATYDIEGITHLASFDFSADILGKMIACLAEPLALQVRRALSHAPYEVHADFMLQVTLVTRLGPPTRGQDDVFVPFTVSDVLASRLEREPIKLADDIPERTFRLRVAFDRLRGL